MKDPISVMIVLLILVFVMFSLFCFGYWDGVHFMQNEAVKHNGAKWVPNEHGKPIFEWNQ